MVWLFPSSFALVSSGIVALESSLSYLVTRLSVLRPAYTGVREVATCTWRGLDSSRKWEGRGRGTFTRPASSSGFKISINFTIFDCEVWWRDESSGEVKWQKHDYWPAYGLLRRSSVSKFQWSIALGCGCMWSWSWPLVANSLGHITQTQLHMYSFLFCFFFRSCCCWSPDQNINSSWMKIWKKHEKHRNSEKDKLFLFRYLWIGNPSSITEKVAESAKVKEIAK